MARERRRRSASGTGKVLLVALGAVAGLAIGMAIADRSGGVEGLLRRKSSRRQRRHRDDGWRGDERRSQRFDEMADDDSELAPEAISHLHLRGRYPETGSRPRREPGIRHSARPASATSPESPLPSADELEARVLEVFRNDPMMAGRNIDIEADELGRIELTGWVDDASEIEYALTLVRGVPQVRGVTNQLAVQPRAVG
jgi:hypothetical protein